MAATDDVVEDEADNGPGHVVGRRRWWDEARATEDNRPVDVFEDRVVEALLDEPL